MAPSSYFAHKSSYSSADFTNAKVLPVTITTQAGKTFAQSAEDLIADLFTKKGLKKMDSKIGSDNGFDVLLVDDIKKPSHVVVLEIKSSSSSASHGAKMNDPVVNCRSAGEAQMSWCWIKDVLDRMLKPTSSETIQKNAKAIEKIVQSEKVDRYVVSVNSAGEAKIIGIN